MWQTCWLWGHELQRQTRSKVTSPPAMCSAIAGLQAAQILMWWGWWTHHLSLLKGQAEEIGQQLAAVVRNGHAPHAMPVKYPK